MTNKMYELFKNEINAADEKLQMKGYAVLCMDKQVAGDNFEIVNMETGETAMDYLSVSQVQQLAEIL
jgi:hypothetical protein